MLLPNFDFELTYWRLRRRLQRIRSEYRYRVSAARAKAHLQYLTWFGRLSEQPQPEETFAYRLMWALVVVSTAGVIAIEATIGEDEFLVRVDAASATVRNLPDRRATAKHESLPAPMPEVKLDKARSIAWLKRSI
jgi:hypothetical protein